VIETEEIKFSKILEICVSQNLPKLGGRGVTHKGWEDRREMK